MKVGEEKREREGVKESRSSLYTSGILKGPGCQRRRLTLFGQTT